jgi:hypothetical protein
MENNRPNELPFVLDETIRGKERVAAGVSKGGLKAKGMRKAWEPFSSRSEIVTFSNPDPGEC